MLLETMTSFNRIITAHMTNYGLAGHTMTSLITILSYPTYICSEAQEDLVLLLEEQVRFAGSESHLKASYNSNTRIWALQHFSSNLFRPC